MRHFLGAESPFAGDSQECFRKSGRFELVELVPGRRDSDSDSDADSDADSERVARAERAASSTGSS